MHQKCGFSWIFKMGINLDQFNSNYLIGDFFRNQTIKAFRLLVKSFEFRNQNAVLRES
jgi:hypothetical protein